MIFKFKKTFIRTNMGQCVTCDRRVDDNRTARELKSVVENDQTPVTSQPGRTSQFGGSAPAPGDDSGSREKNCGGEEPRSQLDSASEAETDEGRKPMNVTPKVQRADSDCETQQRSSEAESETQLEADSETESETDEKSQRSRNMLEDMSASPGNRSLGVADRFEYQLYGESWTDSYEELEAIGRTSEDIHHFLRNIFMHEYEAVKLVARNQRKRICKELLKRGREDIEQLLSTEKINLNIGVDDINGKSETVKRNVNQFKSCTKGKRSDSEVNQNLKRAALDRSSEDWSPNAKNRKVEYIQLDEISNEREIAFWSSPAHTTCQSELGKGIKRYIGACVEISWRMNAQRPPMLAVVDELKETTPFDKTKHVIQSGSGKIVTQIVWPALYLYAKGPLVKHAKVVVESLTTPS